MHITYARYDGCKGFKAFDINEGRQVRNLIYASLVENTEDTRQKLQKLEDLKKGFTSCCNFARKAECAFRLSKR